MKRQENRVYKKAASLILCPEIKSTASGGMAVLREKQDRGKPSKLKGTGWRPTLTTRRCHAGVWMRKAADP